MTSRAQQLLVEGAWFGIGAVVICVTAWLLGEPRERLWYEASLGGLGALSAFRLLT